jgi:hypothetical protein
MDPFTQNLGHAHLRDRSERTTLFRDYLENQWHIANVEANYYDFADLLRSQATTFGAVDTVVQKDLPRQR